MSNLISTNSNIFPVFAAAESYVPLLVARASQGIGSAATTIAGKILKMCKSKFLFYDVHVFIPTVCLISSNQKVYVVSVVLLSEFR